MLAINQGRYVDLLHSTGEVHAVTVEKIVVCVKRNLGNLRNWIGRLLEEQLKKSVFLLVMAEGGIICNADKKVLFVSKVTMFINNL